MIRELVCALVSGLVCGIIGYVLGLNRDMVVINDERGYPLWDDRRIY